MPEALKRGPEFIRLADGRGRPDTLELPQGYLRLGMVLHCCGNQVDRSAKFSACWRQFRRYRSGAHFETPFVGLSISVV
jgi:hypothetical protein